MFSFSLHVTLQASEQPRVSIWVANKFPDSGAPSGVRGKLADGSNRATRSLDSAFLAGAKDARLVNNEVLLVRHEPYWQRPKGSLSVTCSKQSLQRKLSNQIKSKRIQIDLYKHFCNKLTHHRLWMQFFWEELARNSAVVLLKYSCIMLSLNTLW